MYRVNQFSYRISGTKMKKLCYISIALILLVCVMWNNISLMNKTIKVKRASENEKRNVRLKDNENLENRKLNDSLTQSGIYRYISRKTKIADHANDYHIQPDLSKEDNKTILVFVSSRPNNRERRMLIRKTWANATYYQRPDGMQSLVTIFVIGLTDAGQIDESVVDEAESFPDILTVNISDSYVNLVYKVKMALQWINKHSSASYILKVDEDVIINTFAWIKIVDKMTTKNISCFVGGHSMVGTHPRRTGKYQVTSEEYPDGVYPHYCEGPAYMVTRDALPIILEKSAALPLFVMEDIYFTGILVHQTPIHQIGLKSDLLMSRACCARLKNALDTNLQAIVVHYVKEKHWKVIWQQIEHERNTDRTFAFEDFTDNLTILPSKWTVDAKPKYTCHFNSASFTECC